MASDRPPQRIALTGAGRGMGLEFTRQWLEKGRTVFALARRPASSEGLQTLTRAYPDRLRLVTCDVADEVSVKEAAHRVSRETGALDLLLNNAGATDDRKFTLETLDFAETRAILEVNTLGPIAVTRAFLPLLVQGTHPRVAHISSILGSVESNQPGDWGGSFWAYRISKTALNMAARNMALELRPKGIACVLLHPGWVRTDMGGKEAVLSVEEAVTPMVELLDRIGLEQTGTFLDRKGRPVPW